ncbi:thiol-disulfide oxidoreductase DCC family protein [Evansella cellulosilytica]|uniref:Thiol-disulfide oxidoreductase DCC n=1 Tax=Evansella cellulosilytica (strain ATCC 21833 / DSM 2522 / FERM P-1141 / JCM 9156 / N-4) TaxID=649639 RepID=E6TZQ2_EVAC2|nr:thiol-disulfide oxidoreductase DCC family protein [Evansella cellulosilytica]ADU31358.1 thiol-disulfide oxidoreductase DCC [Evansella cellulosilytica DSM 2522]
MKSIILFDGVCNFCVGSVQFIIKRDKNARYQFASLQSEIGNKLKAEYQIPENINSFILIEDNQVFYKSTAALRVCKGLDRGWRAFYPLIIVPRPIRDLFYSLISNNRYKWFGKKESCMIPSRDIRERFLE